MIFLLLCLNASLLLSMLFSSFFLLNFNHKNQGLAGGTWPRIHLYFPGQPYVPRKKKKKTCLRNIHIYIYLNFPRQEPKGTY